MFNYSYTRRERSLFIAFLVVAGMLLRVYPMVGYYYNSDEMLHLGIASASSLKQVWEYSLYETHPPLGHYIRHFWMMLGGDGILWNRSLSMVFGLLLIPLMYLCGKAVSGRSAGMVAAVMTTFVPHAVEISNVVRNYSISAFFTAAAILFFFRYTKKQTRKDFGAFAIFVLLSALTHYTNQVVLLSLIGAYTLSLYRSRAYRAILPIATVGVAALIISLLIAMQQIGYATGYTTGMPKLWDIGAHVANNLIKAWVFMLFLFCNVFSSIYLVAVQGGDSVADQLIKIISLGTAVAILASFFIANSERKITTKQPELEERLLRHAFRISLVLVIIAAIYGLFGYSLMRRIYCFLQLATLLIAHLVAGNSKQAFSVKRAVSILVFMLTISVAGILTAPKDERRVDAAMTNKEWEDLRTKVEEISASRNLIYVDQVAMINLLWQRDSYYEFLKQQDPFNRTSQYRLGKATVIYRYSDINNPNKMAALSEILKDSEDKYDNIVFIVMKGSEGRHIGMARGCFGKLQGANVLMNTELHSEEPQSEEFPNIFIVSVPAQIFIKEIMKNDGRSCDRI